jgi:hypothetical protein
MEFFGVSPGASCKYSMINTVGESAPADVDAVAALVEEVQ